ncbi:MAG TPA: hypothetical protein VKM37_07650 [Balneolaceae bacterium]|nr:hypothetical protein [Balneolaceae bacterium]
MSFLHSKKAALVCLLSGIFLLGAGYFLTQDSPLLDLSLHTRQTWYLITGLALSISGIVQLMRDDTF